MWNKAKPSPIENVRIAMSELGKFHGLSTAMKDQKPDEFVQFQKVNDLMKICFKSNSLQKLFNGSFDRALSALKNNEHKAIMQHIKDNSFSYVKDCLNDEAEFGVLCHGDFWNNNMLFKFNDNETAEEVRLLAWQLIRYTSPAIDIVYNLFTSTDKSLRDAEFHSFLELYYESLSGMVKPFGSDPDKLLFTFENLEDELKKYGNYVLLMAPILSEVTQADSSKITKLDDAFHKMAEGNGAESLDLITGLSDEGQLEYERRLGDIFTDVIRLGYYHRSE